MSQAIAASVPGNSPTAELDPEQQARLVQLITKLLQQKQDAVKEVARRASAGQGLTVRGNFVDAKVLQLALEAHAKLTQSKAPHALAVAPAVPPRVSAGAHTVAEVQASTQKPVDTLGVSFATVTAGRRTADLGTSATASSPAKGRAPSAQQPGPFAVVSSATPRAGSVRESPQKSVPVLQQIGLGAAVTGASVAEVPESRQTTAQAPQASGVKRFAPDSTATVALASQAINECDDATPFSCVVKVVGEHKVGVLAKPDVKCSPDEHISPGSTANVIARTVSKRDGRVYLRLKLSGWITTRSRKHIAKVVLLAVDDSVALEPPDAVAALSSRAAAVVPSLDAFGSTLQHSGDSGARKPTMFRTLLRTPILDSPSFLGGTVAGASVCSKEEFMVSGAYVHPSDGRAYLRLQDGRGWVCERVRYEFSRHTVQMASLSNSSRAGGGHVEDAAPRDPGRKRVEDAAPRDPGRKKVDGSKKIVVVTREPDPEAETEMEAAVTPVLASSDNPEVDAVVFRSDKDLWPEGTVPRPLVRSARAKLRGLHDVYGIRLRECHQDLSDVEEKAATFVRLCPSKQQLLDYAAEIKKEIHDANKEWSAKVHELCAALEGGNATTDQPEESVNCDSFIPVQVRGDRWYCASLPTTCSQEVADGERLRRHLGPLRATADEALQDVRNMRQRLSAGA